VPEIFDGYIEMDEIYLDEQMKNRKPEEQLKYQKRSKITRGLEAIKQPVFDILCRNDKVWIKMTDKTEVIDLQPYIEKQVKKGSTVCSDT
jgi:rRNA pseudouridine-1189 N-methylase Emg1 (Nep1/Mra1 family)